MRPIGTAWRARLACSGPPRGKRGVGRAMVVSIRCTVARLMVANCSSSSGVRWHSPNCAKCRAVGSNAGVSRSAQMWSRLSHTVATMLRTASPYRRPRCRRRGWRSSEAPFSSRTRLLRCSPVTCSISVNSAPRPARSAWR